MTDPATESIWYVSFGSNMAAQRLARYLAKGRDPSPPTDSRPIDLGHPIFFAGETRVWGTGGVAFLDVDTPATGPAYGRAWRLTIGQFEDIYRQENGLDGVVPVDVASLRVGASSEAASSDAASQRYGALWRFEDIDDEPAITFTSGSHRPTPNAAGPAYLRIIAVGLAEGWGVAADVIVDYLLSCEPNASAYTRADLAAIVG